MGIRETWGPSGAHHLGGPLPFTLSASCPTIYTLLLSENSFTHVLGQTSLENGSEVDPSIRRKPEGGTDGTGGCSPLARLGLPRGRRCLGEGSCQEPTASPQRPPDLSQV